ncbi:MAG: BCCT family transporter, partial [Phycisphaerales bacterium]
ATLCIVLFFVTSSDSALMVIDIIASGGNPDPPVGTRLFWAVTEGLVASALLLAGGLVALQAASITVALPFTLILILACVSLLKALRQEYAEIEAREDAPVREE